MNDKNFLILAFYLFDRVEDPEQAVRDWKKCLTSLDAKGRIYISEEGINAQMSIHERDFEAFRSWFLQQEPFCHAEVKIHRDSDHAFAKMTVKYREQIVALDTKVDLTKRGTHLSPEEWKKMLETREEDTLLIDVRNDYEWQVGHFEGAIHPELKTFREFPKYARNLKEKVDPTKTKVMMYCTGGIRCELYSSLLMDEGFETVYQLEGGVIKYGLEEGNSHWKGSLFVFDDRLVVPISEDPHEKIGHCQFCKEPEETYYNCANMDCNALFIACRSCYEEHVGCCQTACQEAPRLRPYVKEERPKPFRKLPFEEKQALAK